MTDALCTKLTLFLGGVLLLAPIEAPAGVDSLIEEITHSQFRFARSTSDVPFPPLGWTKVQYIPNARFEDSSGVAVGSFDEITFSEGVLVPIYEDRNNMVLLGEDALLETIRVNPGPPSSQRVLSVMPMAVWMRQIDRDNLAGAFVAPLFSRELDHHDEWGTQAFVGIIAVHWKNDAVQWLYGGVYENSFGRDYFYPYLGVLWLPTRNCSLSLVFPWPTFSYAPRDRVLFSVGMSPGGSSWISEQKETKATYSLVSWNLMASTSWRFYGKFWLQAGFGVAGLSSVKVTAGNGAAVRKVRPAAAYSLAIQFRP